jgi:hypothetical protein
MNKALLVRVEDRYGSEHRLRVDRICAYYKFEKVDENKKHANTDIWAVSIVFFGCNTPYTMEFTTGWQADEVLTMLDKHFDFESA